MRRLRRRREEDGATLVEFALVFSLLMMLAIGAFEFGMLFRDYLSVSIASREGSRVAASAANYGDADCVVLEATTGALRSFRSGRIVSVHIFQSDETGNYPAGGNVNIYRPPLAGDPVGLPIEVCSTSEWVRVTNPPPWPPSARINAAPGATPDWIGVRVVFAHPWYTNFLWWNGERTFTDQSVFRLEPPAPGF